MAAKAAFEMTIGVVFVGIMLVAFSAAWDYLIYGMNIMDMMGYQTQDAMNCMTQLTLLFNSVAIVYIIALALSVILSAKNRRSLEQ